MPPKPYFKDGTFRKRYNKWQYRFMHEGSQISVSGDTKEECFKKRLDIMAGKTTIKGGLTFGQWLTEWHKLYDNKSESDKNIKQNKKYIDSVILKLGDIPLKKLLGSDIQKFLNTYNDRKNTRDKIAKKIKSALTMAQSLGKINANPYITVDIKKHIPKPNRSLTFSEQRIISEKISKDFYNLYNFCCCTGLRISEALNVRKKDIDYETGQIFAKRLKKRGKEVIAPVPFLPELLNFKFTDYLFNITYDKFQDYLESFYKDVNIDGVMIHTFRHTFASNCHKAGIPDKQIQEWLCHKTLAMTQDIYMHLIKDSGTSPQYQYIVRLKKHLGI